MMEVWLNLLKFSPVWSTGNWKNRIFVVTESDNLNFSKENGFSFGLLLMNWLKDTVRFPGCLLSFSPQNTDSPYYPEFCHICDTVPSNGRAPCWSGDCYQPMGMRFALPGADSQGRNSCRSIQIRVSQFHSVSGPAGHFWRHLETTRPVCLLILTTSVCRRTERKARVVIQLRSHHISWN